MYRFVSSWHPSMAGQARIARIPHSAAVALYLTVSFVVATVSCRGLVTLVRDCAAVSSLHTRRIRTLYFI